MYGRLCRGIPYICKAFKSQSDDQSFRESPASANGQPATRNPSYSLDITDPSLHRIPKLRNSNYCCFLSTRADAQGRGLATELIQRMKQISCGTGSGMWLDAYGDVVSHRTESLNADGMQVEMYRKKHDFRHLYTGQMRDPHTGINEEGSVLFWSGDSGGTAVTLPPRSILGDPLTALLGISLTVLKSETQESRRSSEKAGKKLGGGWSIG